MTATMTTGTRIAMTMAAESVLPLCANDVIAVLSSAVVNSTVATVIETEYQLSRCRQNFKLAINITKNKIIKTQQ